MDVHCIPKNSQKKTAVLRRLYALVSLTRTRKHTNTRMPPPVRVGEGYYLMESCFIYLFIFFPLLSPFPQTPCLPCQENNESTKPFVRTSTQHFPPPPAHPSPKKTTHAAFTPPQCYLNVVSLPSPPPPPPIPCPHACLPAPLLAARPRRQAFFFLVISSARSRCARDYCEMKVGGGGREREERRCGAGERK